jgi:hypothetical protein
MPPNNWDFRLDFWDDSGAPTIVSSIREFLDENGYSEIPLPESDERLFWDFFRPTKNDFVRNYIWHPIIIRPSAYMENGAELYMLQRRTSRAQGNVE